MEVCSCEEVGTIFSVVDNSFDRIWCEKHRGLSQYEIMADHKLGLCK